MLPQLDEAERGFSFMRDGPLDMRMDPGAALSAEELVNTAPEAELGRLLREYGEERNWRGVARRCVCLLVGAAATSFASGRSRHLVTPRPCPRPCPTRPLPPCHPACLPHRIAAAREESPITTTQQLVRAVGGRHVGGKHPATRAFQALRIAVNGELHSLAAALPDALACLAPGGRLAVITFHSLEDRVVKWAFRRAAGTPGGASAHPLGMACCLARLLSPWGGGGGRGRQAPAVTLAATLSAPAPRRHAALR